MQRGGSPDSPFLNSLVRRDSKTVRKPHLGISPPKTFAVSLSPSGTTSRGLSAHKLSASPFSGLPQLMMTGDHTVNANKKLDADFPEQTTSLGSYLRDIKNALSSGLQKPYAKPSGRPKTLEELTLENRQYSRALAKLSSNHAVLLRRKRLELELHEVPQVLGETDAGDEAGACEASSPASPRAADLRVRLEQVAAETAQVRRQLAALEGDPDGPLPTARLEPQAAADAALLAQLRTESRPRSCRRCAESTDPRQTAARDRSAETDAAEFSCRDRCGPAG